MKKACLVVSEPYTNGEIFNKENRRLNRDDCLLFFHLLRDEFLKRQVDLNTQDINSPDACETVIYNEMPSVLPREEDAGKSYLLLFESELIRPDNWDLNSHKKFKKIFTWNDDFVDNKKYFKMNLTHSGTTPFIPFEEKTKFCTLIAGNKSVSHPLGLYSKRREAIRWFEANHPRDFEFFGVGWGQYTFKGPKLIRALNRNGFLRKLLAEKWPSYRGMVDSKLSVLSQFKFSVCYENARDISGYITEKIFDSLAAGCIPIYWGAPNVLDYIPEACFVDKRKFSSYEELYSYLQTMSPAAYNDRLQKIQNYLQSAAHKVFTPKFMAESVTGNIFSEEI
jgi:hypothetical protein